MLVEADAVAREAGSALAANVVMIGAASPFLPLEPDAIEKTIRDAFEAKGDRIVDANIRAFEAGREAALAQAPGPVGAP